MKKNILLLLLACWFGSPVAWAQGTLKTYKVEVEQKVVGSNLWIEWYISTINNAPDFPLAASNFSLFINSTGLDMQAAAVDPTGNGPYDEQADPVHYHGITGGATATHINLNVNSRTAVATPGQLVTATPTRIGRFVIPITDHSTTVTATWRLLPMAIHNWAQEQIKAKGEFVTPQADFPLCPVPAQPQLSVQGSQNLCAGQTLTIQSTATHSIQWFKDGQPIAGATQPNLTVGASGVYTVQSQAYQCLSPLSSSVTVAVIDVSSPVLAFQGAAALCAGSPTYLVSSFPGQHVWYHNGLVIPGQAGSTLAVFAPGTYTAKAVATGCQSGISNALVVTQHEQVQPVVSVLNGSTALCPGQKATLSANTLGAYRWYRNGVLVPGAYTQTLEVSEAGSYSAVDISGGCASLLSAPIQITAIQVAQPIVSSSTGGFALCSNAGLTLKSNLPATRWQFNGETIATGTTLAVTKPGTYQAIATNGTCDSEPVSITVISVADIASPVITYTAGVLATHAQGVLQWYRNGVPVFNQTSASFIPTEPGVYTVSVASPCGPVFSEGYDVRTTSVVAQAAGVGIAIYPNPIQQEAQLRLTLDKPSTVAIRLIDVSGKQLAKLADRTFASGTHMLTVQPAALGLAAGTYQLECTTPMGTTSLKLVVIR